MATFLRPHPHGRLVLRRLWQTSPSMFGRALQAVDASEPGLLPHICSALQVPSLQLWTSPAALRLHWTCVFAARVARQGLRLRTQLHIEGRAART